MEDHALPGWPHNLVSIFAVSSSGLPHILLFVLWGLILCIPENLVFFGIPSLLPKSGKKCDRSEILPCLQANKLSCIVSWILIEDAVKHLLSQKDFTLCTVNSMSFLFVPVFPSPPEGWHRVTQLNAMHLVGLHHSWSISSLGIPHLR